MRLLVLNWLDPANPAAGGAEVHLRATFGRLAGQGTDVRLVASGWPGAPARTIIDGIEVYRVGGRLTYPLHAPRLARRLARQRPFDVVVEDLNKAPLFTPWWAGEPTILLVHHLFGRTAFQGASLPVASAAWLLERPLRLAYGRAQVVAVSGSTRDDLITRGFSPGNIRVIENGVESDYYVPGPEASRFERPTLLYLGRLRRYKRVEHILEALALLRREISRAKLLVAGAGDARPALEARARTLGLGAGAVEFLGFVDEPTKLALLQRSWIHVLTSAKEGWGITCLEAGACGTPTVASDSPGLRDAVIDGKTGFLVRHGDTVALAGRLRVLLRDDRRRRAMGKAAREFAVSLSWERASARWIPVLEGAVASRRRAG
ncbi:MAG: glycosyltransferase family 4 protein [Gammaproteobacteria bacterium]|nr:glycosyltransferase family 4 protein [Gammaproteobacteria bacterium]MDE0247694.1 glycosyltransferase family 4 protein [Gammaproteobacteria bacterium]